MSVVWTAMACLSIAGFLITSVMIFVGMFTSYLDFTVKFVLLLVGIPLFCGLSWIAGSKLEEKRLQKYRNVDEQSTRQRTTLLQSSSFLPTKTSNLERPQIPVQQRIPESVPALNPLNEENDHPPCYEEVVQDRFQLQGSEVCQRGSCCAFRHHVEQLTGTNRVAVYIVSLPPEDPTVPNSTASQVQRDLNECMFTEHCSPLV